MWNKKKTQVLVVGAGPVGMMTALCLHDQGIELEIVDKAVGVCSHSNACLLSPETLDLLDRFDLMDEVVSQAIKIDTIELYTGKNGPTKLTLSDLPSRVPFMASISQSDLESLLLARLTKAHVPVLWNHRVTSVVQEADKFAVEVDRLSEHMMGYAVMHKEKLVDKTFHFQSKLLLAADGMHSLIRRLKKINYARVGNGAGTLVFEVKRDSNDAAILKLGFSKDGAWAYVPLPHDLGRYSFVTDHLLEISADRDKEHEIYEDDLIQFPELSDDHLNDLLKDRMPFLAEKKQEILWRASVPFGELLADQFYKDGIFLLGDAARSGFPLAAKSLNLGLQESEKVAVAVNKYLETGDNSELLETASAMRAEWEDLSSLGYSTPAHGSKPVADPNRILQALPLTGKDLDYIAGKLDRFPELSI